MKYFSTFKWVLIVGGLIIAYNIITSPDAGTAGERSAGIVVMLFGAFLVWFILEMFAIGKNDDEKVEGKK